jgi:SAM-dependent methyltransferase
VPTPAAEAFSFALRRRRFRRELVCRYRGTSCVIDSNDVQAHITGFWSTVAADYDAHAGNVAEHGSVEYRRWVDVLASVLPDPPGDVLDVATGSGYVALAAASIGQRVTAIDLAPAMLEELVANATARSLTVDARRGDAVAPDFAPASFDAVTSRHLLWTLREAARAMVNQPTPALITGGPINGVRSPGPRSAAASALGHARFEGPGTGLLAAALDGGYVRPAARGDAAGVVGIWVPLGSSWMSSSSPCRSLLTRRTS